MTVLNGDITEHVAANPDALFDLITDLDRLPEWNDHTHHLVAARRAGTELRMGRRDASPGLSLEQPSSPRTPRSAGAPLRLRQHDRRREPVARLWSWHVTPHTNGSTVAVAWQLEPKTFWRKALLASVRHHQLKWEVRASIHALAALAATPTSHLKQIAGESSRTGTR